MDDWLKRRAMNNQINGASRTFVVVDEENRVYGFYAMAAGAVSHQLATSVVRHNMPDPVPVMVLGRLGVDLRAQGIKLGAAMLQDAVNRAIAAAPDDIDAEPEIRQGLIQPLEVFGDPSLTTAHLDRLSHHAHVLVFQGESY